RTETLHRSLGADRVRRPELLERTARRGRSLAEAGRAVGPDPIREEIRADAEIPGALEVGVRLLLPALALVFDSPLEIGLVVVGMRVERALVVGQRLLRVTRVRPGVGAVHVVFPGARGRVSQGLVERLDRLGPISLVPVGDADVAVGLRERRLAQVTLRDAA